MKDADPSRDGMSAAEANRERPLPAEEAASEALEYLRESARALFAAGDYAAATEVLRRIERLAPEDDQTAAWITQAAIHLSRERAGLDWPVRRQVSHATAELPGHQATHLSEAGLASEALDAADPVHAKIPLTEVQQLEAAIRERPGAPTLYLQLARLYVSRGREFDAERILARGRTATDHDPRIELMWEDVLLLRHEKRVQLLRMEVASDETSAAREALDHAVRAGQQQQIEIFQARVSREPYHAGYRYQLGVYLQRAGRLDEAQAELQRAAEVPEYQCAAWMQMGQRHRQEQNFAEALKYYRRAADPCTPPGAVDLRRDALRQAMEVAQQLKLPRLAARYHAELQRLIASGEASNVVPEQASLADDAEASKGPDKIRRAGSQTNQLDTKSTLLSGPVGAARS